MRMEIDKLNQEDKDYLKTENLGLLSTIRRRIKFCFFLWKEKRSQDMNRRFSVNLNDMEVFKY